MIVFIMILFHYKNCRLRFNLMEKKNEWNQYCLESYQVCDPKYRALIMTNLDKLRDFGFLEVIKSLQTRVTWGSEKSVRRDRNRGRTVSDLQNFLEPEWLLFYLWYSSDMMPLAYFGCPELERFIWKVANFSVSLFISI